MLWAGRPTCLRAYRKMLGSFSGCTICPEQMPQMLQAPPMLQQPPADNPFSQGGCRMPVLAGLLAKPGLKF